MRLFAALEVPEAIKYEINAWWQLAYPRLGPDLWRAVLPHQWHMTLAFYGDVAATMQMIWPRCLPFVQMHHHGCTSV